MMSDVMELEPLQEKGDRKDLSNVLYETVKPTTEYEPEPRDQFFIVHLLFLFFGITHLLPVSFFVTANDYWMYKFRSTSSKQWDPHDRSVLQSNFASGSIIAQSIPTVICLLLATACGHKIQARILIQLSLACLVISFIVSTIFIKVNTDSWQTGFFIFTMIILAAMNGFLALFQVTSLAVLSKFPRNYMKTFLIGQGIGGIICSAFQVISLAVGSSPESSALIYFSLGNLMTFFTLLLHYFSKNLKLYQYHVNKNNGNTDKKSMKLENVKEVSIKIWSSLIIVIAGALSYVPTHPAIAALVISENHGQGYEWNDKYFVAVITFLYSDICCLVGRAIAAAFTKILSIRWLVILSVLRMIIFVPLFMFCNALPRRHLTVLFPHDWQYIIILGAYMVTSGYFFNIAFLNVTKLAPKNEETAYMVMQTVTGIIGAVFSPLGVVCVQLL